MIIAIDFDGTIAKITDNPIFPGELIFGADTYINKLHEDGHYIIIWTCREAYNQHICELYLKKYGIHYDRINANAEGHFNFFSHDCRKINADLYIDDKGLYPLPSWKEIYDRIQAMNVE
jgi:hypothetical protein